MVAFRSAKERSFAERLTFFLEQFWFRVKKNVILSEPEASEGSKWPSWNALRNGNVILHGATLVQDDIYLVLFRFRAKNVSLGAKGDTGF